MSFQINNQMWLVLEECVKCGCAFAVTNQFQDQRKQDKGMFYCPNGHAQSYTKSTAQTLQEQLDQEKSKHEKISMQLYWAEQRAVKAEKKLEAMKKKETKAGGESSK